MDTETETITQSSLTAQEKRTIELVKRSPTEEILTEDRLLNKITNKTKLVHYIGYEVSGYVHLGTGLIGMSKVADFTSAGADSTIFLADYHSWINKKLGGDLSTIRRIAGTYFKEALVASLKCVGGDPDKVKFVLGSNLYKDLNEEYWETVLKTASGMSLGRARRSTTVLGRREGDDVNLAQLLYVPMQVSDISALKVNLPHAGMDQRKAHVVALEAAKGVDDEIVAVHHHLLMGMHLKEEQRNKIIAAKQASNREAFENEIVDVKMSKSNPKSAIFIHDSEEEIKSKIMGSYCPAKELDVNPVIDISRYVIWPYLIRKEQTFEITNGKTGKAITYSSQKEMEEAFAQGAIHPVDIKSSVANYLAEILEPAREYFTSGPGKSSLDDLNQIKITK